MRKKITAGTKHLAGMYYRITYHSLFHCSVLEPQPKATVEGGVRLAYSYRGVSVYHGGEARQQAEFMEAGAGN